MEIDCLASRTKGAPASVEMDESANRLLGSQSLLRFSHKIIDLELVGFAMPCLVVCQFHCHVLPQGSVGDDSQTGSGTVSIMVVEARQCVADRFGWLRGCRRACECAMCP